MLIRLGRLTGLPVILCGRACAHVEQAVLEESGRRLRGLRVRGGLGGVKWVAAEDISVLGEVSVVVRRAPLRAKAESAFHPGLVKDTTGLLLGRVTDVLLDPETLRVQALEMVLGVTEAITSGRMLCRRFVTVPRGAGEGEVLIPCGCCLEEPPG